MIGRFPESFSLGHTSDRSLCFSGDPVPEEPERPLGPDRSPRLGPLQLQTARPMPICTFDNRMRNIAGAKLMTRAKRWLIFSLAGIAGFLVLFANENPSLTGSEALLTQAHARVGRPLTPLSGAGVARRTTRRAVGAGAAAAGAVVAPACVRGPYGGVVCR